MKVVKVNAFSKLNLTLDVLGKEGAFHKIDSLVTSVDLSDRIVVKSRRDRLVNVTMHGMGSESISPEKNSAQRAAELFVERMGTTGADITIYKNIPIGAGLGGSSVDAAGVFRALATLYEIDFREIVPLAKESGSDVCCLLQGGLKRMRGRGELVEKIETDLMFYFLLLVPRRGVKTGLCYETYDRLSPAEPATECVLNEIAAKNREGAARKFSNALFDAACALEPDVKRAYEELAAFSPWAVNMTGSGSGVYAVFETPELCAWARSRYRGKFRSYLLKSTENL